MELRFSVQIGYLKRPSHEERTKGKSLLSSGRRSRAKRDAAPSEKRNSSPTRQPTRHTRASLCDGTTFEGALSLSLSLSNVRVRLDGLEGVFPLSASSFRKLSSGSSGYPRRARRAIQRRERGAFKIPLVAVSARRDTTKLSSFEKTRTRPLYRRETRLAKSRF